MSSVLSQADRERPAPWFVLLLVGVLSAVTVAGCKRGADPDQDAPLPSRILTAKESVLQPVQLPEVKRPDAKEVVALEPPPGGDPVARAVVLGEAPVEKAIHRRPDGRLQVGRMIVDPVKGEMLIPGLINQTSGIIEYMAVGPNGKRHESVLMMDVHPLHLQIGCILLGLKAAPLKEEDDPERKVVRKGREEADPAAPEALSDAQVEVLVSWKEDGKLVTRHAEELAYNRERAETMERGPWIYTGSTVYRGVFGAEFEQSYIATWPDRSSLFNSPREAKNPYRGNAFGFEANFAVLPPKGTPARITIRRVAPRPAVPVPGIHTPEAPSAPAAPAPSPTKPSDG